ncbi:MAG: translation initiation factor IF-2 subunit beta [Candidatus Altiarchaeota archaeon]|nr:translation initiation factor IF-2 subunit beta [Candidatus Altiarchaeota archaeon]
MTSDYEAALDRVYSALPAIVFEKKRFEPPRMANSIEGNKTLIKNIMEVADYIGRDPKHLMKFMGKDLGAAWRIDGNRAIMIGKFGSVILNKKLDKYVKDYVICSVCEKPDTKLVKVDRVFIMKCEACGAMSPIPPL